MWYYIPHKDSHPLTESSTLETRLKAKLGEELYEICNAGDLSALLAHQTPQDPSREPILEAKMFAAARKDHVAIVQHCLASGAKLTLPLLELISGNRPLKTYEAMLTAKAVDPNVHLGYSRDMLTNAAMEDDIELTRLCLSHGADPNRHLFEDMKTALAAVAETASVAMAATLLDHGAILHGSGAIVLAAEAGKVDMVEFLLERGADVNEIGVWHPSDRRYDEDIGSALHRAICKGHDELVPFLIGEGAGVNLEDMKGRTPLAWAKAKGNDTLVSMLKTHGATELVGHTALNVASRRWEEHLWGYYFINIDMTATDGENTPGAVTAISRPNFHQYDLPLHYRVSPPIVKRKSYRDYI